MSASQLVGGRYELVECVGRGGEGEVWRAHDRQHQRLVAIKVRRVGRSRDREALLREARVLLSLRPHPALPLVRDDFFEGNSYHLVMDWAEGTDLGQLLTREGRPGLPLESVLGYLRQVADALDHLHAHVPPIVHQDVKPANVIVGADGDVILVDFGISSRTHDRIEATIGTPVFRAPELQAGVKPSPAADVYGLAVTAFTLLTGAPPSPGPRPLLTRVPPAHVARVWRALDAGLAYDPDRRPLSAGSFVDGLEPAAAATNIARATSVFVGRERDISSVTELLVRSRLLTLTGAGGLGKTRLAIEVAGRMASAYGDGVWLAELAPVRSESLVAGVVAGLFGVEESTGRTLAEGVLEELRDRNLLLVLDNCEHVLQATAEFAESIAQRCPGIDILATSRQALGLTDEVVYDVLPLSLPTPDDEGRKSLALSDAVRLFLDRAAVARPGFRMTDETGAVIARICRRLDGMPLAIELAASRTGRIRITEMAQRLEESVSMLEGDARALARHRTLHATFQWSYSLVPPDERDVFARVAIFPGGFTLSAAEALAGSDALDVARLVTGLKAKSLIVGPRDEGGEHRYGMLETVRAFALERLAEQGAEDETRTRALAWALEQARRGEVGMEDADRAFWLGRLDVEHENLREILSLALDAGDADAVPLAAALSGYWAARGPWGQGRRFLAGALNSGSGSDELRASVMTGAGHLAFLEADYDVARHLHGEALRVYGMAGDRARMAKSQAHLGQVAEARGDFALARDLYDRSLAAFQELGDARGAAEQLTNLGNVAEYVADYETAQHLHEECLAQRRALGDQHGVATSLLNLAYVMAYRGDARGRPALEECLVLYRQLGDRYGESRALNLLAIRTWFEGDGEGARSLGEEALRIRREIGDRLGIAVSIESLAGLCAFQGHGVRAAELFGAAERLRQVISSPVTPSDKALMDWAIADARKAVGDEAYEASSARGRELTMEAAIELALTQPTLTEA